MDNTIKVIIRFKTFQDTNEEQNSNWIISDEVITFKNQKQDDIFHFDHILPPPTQQEDVFTQIMLPKISFFMQGYNSAVFAYGATSSGKTYTILGPETTITQMVLQNDMFSIDQDSGILPRSFFEIIEGYNLIKSTENVSNVHLRVSYVEIYNEAVYDLLNQKFRNKDQRVDLKIGNITDGPKLIGVKEIEVNDVQTLMQAVALGTKNRSVGVTQFNSRSSRSHVIFSIEMIVEWQDKTIRTSKIQFIDLAGSERLAKQVSKGQMLEETKKINQSLTCLGHCIMALSSKKHKHVPYRDSKLTLLLKECLGGNSNTSFICAVSAAQEHDEKTLQTIKFAQRAKKIVNKVRLNIKLSYDQIERQMNQLKQELQLMEKVLLMHGIKYDKQVFQEANYQFQQSNVNIEQITNEYRKSLRKSLKQKKTQDIKNEFRLKFQLYVDQNSSKINQMTISGSSKQLRTTSSMPSMDGSDEEEEDEEEITSQRIDDQLNLVNAIEEMMISPKEQEYKTGRSTQTPIQGNYDELAKKKRDTCCQIM